MNVRELRDLIRELPDDMEVFASSDEEGNSFAPLEDWSISMAWQNGSEWETGPTAEEVELNDYYSDEDLPPAESKSVFVLWP